MSIFSNSGDGGAQQSENLRQAQVTNSENQINKSFSGFDDKFYDTAAQDYTNAQTPQLMSDYRNTKNNLSYALSRGGILNSGSAVNRNNSLNSQLSANESTIANNAQNQANTLRQNVNSQKSTLIDQAVAGTDPTAINSEAQGAVSQLRAPSAIQPLGNLFDSWSSQYLAGLPNGQNTNNNQNNIWNSLNNASYGTF